MADYPAIYYVDRTTDTPADTLLAFGLADVIANLIPTDEDWGLGIEATGNGYRVKLKAALPAEWVDEARFFSPLKGLKTKTKKPSLPAAYVVDYVAHQTRNQAYADAVSKKATPEMLKEQGLEPPHPDWSVWAVVNHMKATDTFNRLVAAWYAHQKCFPDLLRLMLKLYGAQPNPLDEVEAAWEKLAKAKKLEVEIKAPTLQVTNPGMGKGGNRSKATYSQPSGMTGFWLPEYLKYVGLLQAAIPRMVRAPKESRTKDRKTYVIHPRNLAWNTHRKVFPQFQKALWSSSAIKMDVLAALRYCRAFVEQWRDGLAEGRFAWHRGGRPGDHVAAIESVFYKDMGSAHATLNLSTLVLPQWLPQIDTREQAALYLGMLDEHERIVRNLKEENGDENALLREYRDFLSARDLRAFYRFAQGYGAVLISRMNKRAYAPQFTLANLEVLIMAHNPKLSPILQNPGFQRIAKAIRQSTVTPQYFKSKGDGGPYEVRYGLGAELMRQAAYPDKFAQALGKFLYAYNQETSQIEERYKGNPPVRRIKVSTDDIDQVVALMDEYDPETVASLLVAYGYAREGRADEPAEPQPEAAPVGEVEEGADDEQDE